MMKQHKQYQKLSCIQKRSCKQFCEITKVLCILGCDQVTKRLTQMFFPTTCKIVGSNKKKTKIGKSQRCRVSQ